MTVVGLDDFLVSPLPPSLSEEKNKYTQQQQQENSNARENERHDCANREGRFERPTLIWSGCYRRRSRCTGCTT